MVLADILMMLIIREFVEYLRRYSDLVARSFEYTANNVKPKRALIPRNGRVALNFEYVLKVDDNFKKIY